MRLEEKGQTDNYSNNYFLQPLWAEKASQNAPRVENWGHRATTAEDLASEILEKDQAMPIDALNNAYGILKLMQSFDTVPSKDS